MEGDRKTRNSYIVGSLGRRKYVFFCHPRGSVALHLQRPCSSDMTACDILDTYINFLDTATQNRNDVLDLLRTRSGSEPGNKAQDLTYNILANIMMRETVFIS